ncbi:NRDE family protein [soil metagenome]
MCLIVLAIHPNPTYRLVLIANRDESYARATAPAAEWKDAPGLVAGRDLQSGGTWLGVTRSRRFAAVTNFYDGAPPRSAAPSRGRLVTEFLTSDETPDDYLCRLAPEAPEFAGFNLILGDASSAVWFSNRGPAGPVHLEPGIHGLSNHLLNTPWPKVEIAKRRMASLLDVAPPLNPSDLLDSLQDRTPAPPVEDAPEPTPLERAFSAAFIVTPEYGTRSTSALILTDTGSSVLAERTYDRGSTEFSEVRHVL